MAGSTLLTGSSHHIRNITRTILLCSVISLGIGLTPFHQSNAPISTPNATTAPAFDHVVVILMENHGINDIIGTATYMTNLANTYGLANQYSAVSHPSEPNYIALVGGDTFGISSDGVCCWTINSPNIIDRIQTAGLTWQAWAEDASGSGTCSFSPPRSADHFAFLEFSDMNTASRCANFHSTQSSSDSEFINALNNNPSNFMWLTPNDCDNMHDCSVSTGDAYLATLVPKILTTNLFVTQKAALFVVFDEGNGSYPSDYVYSMWAGPTVKKAFQSSNAYSHYSFLTTLEANWNLPSLTSNDANAAPMTEFFNTAFPPSQLQASFAPSTTTPNTGTPVSFTATASGGTSPYGYSWTYGDGSSSSGITTTHTYATNGTYTVTLSIKDSSSPKQTATNSQTLTVVNIPPTTGDFGSCTSLPTGWNCGNTNGLTGSTSTIVNGVLETRESNPNVGNDTNYYYSTSQRGIFPWSPCQPPATGVLPANLSTVSSTFTPITFTPLGTYRYHIYVALYFWLPNGALTSGLSTYQCLDTQVRVENVNGIFSPVGTTATYNPGDSFGWDNVTIQQTTIGQTYTLTAYVQNQCKQDLSAWGLSPITQCQLTGIEIGTEGFQFQELDVNWQSVNLATATQLTPLTASINSTTTGMHARQSISFAGITNGGTAPYIYSWTLGDGATASGPTINHTYSTAGKYTVTLVVSDSSTAIQSYTTTQVIQVGTPCVPAEFAAADVNHNGIIDIFDFSLIAHAYGSTPSSANWNSALDFNQDGIINLIDISIVDFYFGLPLC